MASDHGSKRSQLFTLRVWSEEVDGGDIEWRGKVQRTVSRETLYFREWEALLSFLRAPVEQHLSQQADDVGNDK
jgi:hypothetical protein